MAVTVVLLAAAFVGCDCIYDFKLKGKVRSSDGNPIGGVTVWASMYHLQESDLEEGIIKKMDEPVTCDFRGRYILQYKGMYACGPGAEDVDDPGDYGGIHFRVEADGYLPCDTFFRGGSLPTVLDYYVVPDILLLPDTSGAENPDQ